MLKPETNIVRLISFLRKFLTHLTMIKSHAGNMFIDKGFALILAQTRCLHSLMDSGIRSHHE
jgi:hypothetical protein